MRGIKRAGFDSPISERILCKKNYLECNIYTNYLSSVKVEYDSTYPQCYVNAMTNFQFAILKHWKFFIEN